MPPCTITQLGPFQGFPALRTPIANQSLVSTKVHKRRKCRIFTHLRSQFAVWFPLSFLFSSDIFCVFSSRPNYGWRSACAAIVLQYDQRPRDRDHPLRARASRPAAARQPAGRAVAAGGMPLPTVPRTTSSMQRLRRASHDAAARVPSRKTGVGWKQPYFRFKFCFTILRNSLLTTPRKNWLFMCCTLGLKIAVRASKILTIFPPFQNSSCVIRSFPGSPLMIDYNGKKNATTVRPACKFYGFALDPFLQSSRPIHHFWHVPIIISHLQYTSKYKRWPFTSWPYCVYRTNFGWDAWPS